MFSMILLRNYKRAACKYIWRDAQLHSEDIEHHLASLPEEYALFRVSMDSAKALPISVIRDREHFVFEL